jgi:hypothetical protein
MPPDAEQFLRGRSLLVVLCDPQVPRAVRLALVADLVDEGPDEGSARMTVRDRAARIRVGVQVAEAAWRPVRRAWRDPQTGRLWRGRPRTWPLEAHWRWFGTTAGGVIQHKRALTPRAPAPRTRRRPLGPPRRTHRLSPATPRQTRGSAHKAVV